MPTTKIPSDDYKARVAGALRRAEREAAGLRTLAQLTPNREASARQARGVGAKLFLQQAAARTATTDTTVAEVALSGALLQFLAAIRDEARQVATIALQPGDATPAAQAVGVGVHRYLAAVDALPLLVRGGLDAHDNLLKELTR